MSGQLVKTTNIKDFLFYLYRKLGEKFPFIDTQKVGIWGWSYGGYAATQVLARDNGTEHVYKCAIGIGKPVDWALYSKSNFVDFQSIATLLVIVNE